MTALLGLDVGDRRIGVAVAPQGRGARPLLTLARSTPERDAASLRRLVDEHQVTELVVGLPLGSTGEHTSQSEATVAWAEAIGPLVGLPVTWRDERHTSQIAEARIGGPARGRAGGPPSALARRSRRARVDREAAVAILQAELDARAGLPVGSPA